MRFNKTYKNRPNQYAIKSINIRPNKKKQEIEQTIQSELAILDKITTNCPKPNAIPNYYGHFVVTNQTKTDNYILVFDFFPSNLKGLIQSQITKKKPIDFLHLKGIYHSLLNGLAFLQSLNMCHRDLSPNNLMLDNKGTVKIIDYGVSKDITDLAQLNQQEFSLTIAGKVCYMAPEVLEAFIADESKVFNQ